MAHQSAVTGLDTLDQAQLDRVVSRRGAVGTIGTAAAALALASVPLGLGVFARRAFGQGSPLPQGIEEVLNFALTLEYLEAEFYAQGLAAVGLIPFAQLRVFEQLSKHEDAHVELLSATLGANAIAKPAFDFTAGGRFDDVFTNYDTFLALAQGFEDIGLRAYKGQMSALVSNKALLTVALRIHSVEARHASVIRRMRGQNGWVTGSTTDLPELAPVYVGEAETTQAGVNTFAFVNTNAATEAFDEPMTKESVLEFAGSFIVA